MAQANALSVGQLVTRLYASIHSPARRTVVLEALVTLAKDAEAGGRLNPDTTRILSDAGITADDRRAFVAQVSDGAIRSSDVEDAVRKALAPETDAQAS
jgi:hypothetical protein